MSALISSAESPDNSSRRRVMSRFIPSTSECLSLSDFSSESRLLRRRLRSISFSSASFILLSALARAFAASCSSEADCRRLSFSIRSRSRLFLRVTSADLDLAFSTIFAASLFALSIICEPSAPFLASVCLSFEEMIRWWITKPAAKHTTPAAAAAMKTDSNIFFTFPFGLDAKHALLCYDKTRASVVRLRRNFKTDQLKRIRRAANPRRVNTLGRAVVKPLP